MRQARLWLVGVATVLIVGGIVRAQFGFPPGNPSALGLSGVVPVANGGTAASTLLTHGVLLGQGTGAVTATAVGTTGQVFTGVSAADPVWATIGGDVSGTIAALSVDKVKGTPLGTMTATDGRLLVMDGDSLESVAMSGDATLAGTGTITLANLIAASSCTNCSLTYDAKGRITVGASGSSTCVDCGTGADGACTYGAGTTTLAAPKNCTTITVQDTAIVITAGWPMHATGAVDVQAGGIVHNDGDAGATANGAAGGFFLPGANGNGGGCAAAGGVVIATVNSAYTSTTAGAGGAGAVSAGGAGGTSTIGMDPSGMSPHPAAPILTTAVCVHAATPNPCSGIGKGGAGGGGNGGGQCGGNGGAGGGVVYIAGASINVSGTVRANGGAGQDAVGTNSGGGGGGSGGLVILRCPTGQYTHPGTVTAAAGAGGAKTGSGVAGSAGSAGIVATPGN